MKTPPGFALPALWYCVLHLSAALAHAQCTNPVQIPNQTISSGAPSFTDTNALRADGVVVNGSASATFIAGNCISLKPGFRATAGSAATTFHAWVQTLPAAVSAAPLSGTGLSQTFVWTAASPAGYSSLAEMYGLFNTVTSGVNGCYIRYDRINNLLHLADNGASAWTGGFAPGTTQSVENSQCKINGSGASAIGTGTQLALTVQVEFKAGFTGTKNNYLSARDNIGQYSPWQQMGTWTVGGTQQYTLTTAASPSGGGFISLNPPGGVYSSGTAVLVAAMPAQGYTFTGWAGNLSGVATPQSLLMNGNKTVTANFTGSTIQQVITSNPAGLSLTVDGATCVAPCVRQWQAGSGHTISAATQPGLPGAQYVFSSWSDSGASTHSITAPSSSTTYTAAFATQYLLTASASSGGTISLSPSGPWYYSGTQVQVAATANTGYQFSGFGGALSGTNSPQWLTLSGPLSVSAEFTSLTAPDFVITVSPPQSMPPGQLIAGIPVTITPRNGFASPVNLTWTNPSSWPTDLTASFGQNPATGTTNISTGSSEATPPGQYTLQFTGTSGAIAHNAQVVIPVPDIDIWYSYGLVALDIGDVYDYFATWVTGPDAAGARSQVQEAKLSLNGVQVFPTANGPVAPGSDPSVLQSPTFVLPSMGFGAYGFDFYYAQDWCCWVMNGQVWPWRQGIRRVDSVTYPAPSISSLAPTYALPGSTVELTINGAGLGIADADVDRYRGITSVNIYGNGCPTACGITATVMPVPVGDTPSGGPPPAASSAEASITVSPTARSGTYQISVTAFGAESNRVDFIVGDSTPYINYITQQPLQPGQQGSIDIHGADFGAGCNNLACPGASIAVCHSGDGSCASSDVAPLAVTFWSDTQITATLSAGPLASGSYDVQVTSAGAAGLGFTPTPAPSTSSQSNRKSIAVNTNPILRLQVTSNGSTLSENSCAYITAAPAMPAIAASIVANDGSPLTGTATWQLVTTFQHKKQDPETDTNSTPFGPLESVPANQPWLPALQSFFGGNAQLKWTYNGNAQQPFNFRICGTNPDYGTVGGVLDAMPHWFARKLASRESNMSQFCEAGRMDILYCEPSKNNFGWPVLGAPAGYGMMQLDPAPTADLLWNWRANAEGGKTRLDQMAGPSEYTNEQDGRAYPFWIRQVRQWNEYNRDRQNPNDRIAPPLDRQETGNCKFTLPLNKPWDGNKDSVGLEAPTEGTNNTYWFGDAILIKQYNGAAPNYVSWLDTAQPPRWSYQPVNPAGRNYVREVCSCTGAPATCQ